MEYTGINKIAAHLKEGDFITTTGYSEHASEVQGIYLSGNKVIVKTSDGKSISLSPGKLMRLYK